jgi:15-cis-phytoene synthase
MMQIFNDVSFQCSKITTERYSTSFSSAIRLLHKDLRKPIYNIYGFVRFADEIVDTFHIPEKEDLLQEFKHDTFRAIERKISLNPVLNSFQQTVNEFGIELNLIEAFFKSMEWDLKKRCYNASDYNQYIYGSAEVVGLMCLPVFCENDYSKFEQLKSYARSLGAAFQKVNFLRDLQSDYIDLNRTYFPEVDFRNFTNENKAKIEQEIYKDFKHAYEGIKQLPLKAKFGVYVAYKYYFSLFQKIRETRPEKILQERIRIPNYHKALIFLRAGVKNQLRLI